MDLIKRDINNIMSYDKFIEEQNHLNINRVKLLTKYVPEVSYRPEGSFIELINWVRRNFANYAPAYIHNRIVMDGAFMRFCEERGYEIECLYNDSIASWKTEHNYEHFVAQGVFRIFKDEKKELNNFKFIHAGLFHKGNQYEDEVSFFVLVEDKHFEQYIKFRNEYDDWVKQRDREMPEIYVAGGQPILYKRGDITWDDVYLPENIRIQIKSSVEGFLTSEQRYKSKKIPWKKGLLFWGPQGTGKTSSIKLICSEYNLKPVTIQAGHANTDEILEEAFYYASEHGPSLLFLEDLSDLLQQVQINHFLNLMDGINSKDGVFIIATANDISKIQQNITDRPSRFDRKIEFPLPDYEMSQKYLFNSFKNTITEENYKEIINITIKNKFSYAHLQELYFSSFLRADKESREDPNIDDIKYALSELVSDKKDVLSGFAGKTKKKVDLL